MVGYFFEDSALVAVHPIDERVRVRAAGFRCWHRLIKLRNSLRIPSFIVAMVQLQNQSNRQLKPDGKPHRPGFRIANCLVKRTSLAAQNNARFFVSSCRNRSRLQTFEFRHARVNADELLVAIECDSWTRF